jgi:single stranded DNA-binding protein
MGNQIAGEFGIVFDPEIKFSDKGNAWLKLRGKSSERVKDSTGKWTDGKVTFVDILCFGKQAENLYESIVKGDSVVVVGKMEAHEWQDSDGDKRVDYRIMADSIGVSVRWKPTKASPGDAHVQAVQNLGGMVKEPEQAANAPF